MINLYIDFDGVILNTIELAEEMMRKNNITYSNIEAVDEFYTNLNWNYLLSKTRIINDGIESIQRIIDSNKFDVAILTKINSLHEAIEKIEYIRQYFKDITIIPVPQKISKTKMVHTKGSILIDDTDTNLEEWHKEGGISIKFSENLTAYEFKTINKLDEVINMF